MALSSDLQVPTAQDFKRYYLEDIEVQCIDAGIDPPPTAPGTELDMAATAQANIASVALANQQILDSDANPLTATGEPLDELRARLGLPVVLPSPSSGTLAVTIIGTGNVPAGLAFQAPGAVTGKISTLTLGSGLVHVNAATDSTGEATRLPAGTQVRFVNPPPNILTTATVDAPGFTGGTDSESDERKRSRILNRLQNPPQGGNASQLIDVAMAATGAISATFVYDALGGPGSSKIVLVTADSAAGRNASADSITKVSDAIKAAFPSKTSSYVVQSALSVPVSLALGVRFPASGAKHWLSVGLNLPGHCTVSAGTTFTVAPLVAGTYSGPALGDQIAYWESASTGLKFHRGRVTAVSTSDGGYSITVDTWSDGGAGPAVGEYVCPDSDLHDSIADNWKSYVLQLGPGENIQETDPMFSRAARYPDESQGAPMSLGLLQVGQLRAAIAQIVDGSILYYTPALSPQVPALRVDRPQILVMQHFGVYPI